MFIIKIKIKIYNTVLILGVFNNKKKEYIYIYIEAKEKV